MKFAIEQERRRRADSVRLHCRPLTDVSRRSDGPDNRESQTAGLEFMHRLRIRDTAVDEDKVPASRVRRLSPVPLHRKRASQILVIDRARIRSKFGPSQSRDVLGVHGEALSRFPDESTSRGQHSAEEAEPRLSVRVQRRYRRRSTRRTQVPSEGEIGRALLYGFGLVRSA